MFDRCAGEIVSIAHQNVLQYEIKVSEAKKQEYFS